MRVRTAAGDDLIAIGHVADAAQWESYDGLLDPPALQTLIERNFSPSRLRATLQEGVVLVAVEDGTLVGFAHAEHGDAQIVVKALSTLPGHRRRGVAATLLEAVREMDPSLPVCADVLLGNLDGERFYESQGFVPGEVLAARVDRSTVVERRWWLSPG